MRKIYSAFIFLLMSASFSAHAQTILFQDPELFTAAQTGDYDKLRNALVRGENPNVTNIQKTTPLIVAAKGEDIAIMELLIEYNANVNWQDSLGNTALYYSVDKSAYETVDFLLKNGANPDYSNSQGVTPLMIAARIGDRDILRLLLDQKPELTQKDYTGRTLLDYARESRVPSVIDILQRAGATD